VKLGDIDENATVWTAKGPAFVLAVKRTPIQWRNTDEETLDERFERDDVLSDYQQTVELTRLGLREIAPDNTEADVLIAMTSGLLTPRQDVALVCRAADRADR
jgi:hypothetical protein